MKCALAEHDDLVDCPRCHCGLIDDGVPDEPYRVRCTACGWRGTLREAALGQVEGSLPYVQEQE